MTDFLDVLARNAKETVSSGFYECPAQTSTPHASLKKAILECSRAAVITEIKCASPSAGTLRKDFQIKGVAEAMERGGATGISVLTEPKHFNGSLKNLVETRKAVKLPILMKDIIVSRRQLEAAPRIGANVTLLIQALFDRGHCECSREEMIMKAHSMNLEVLLETHSENEFLSAVSSDADIVGINNRDLRTLKVNLNVTKRILEKNGFNGKLVMSESGIKTPEDIHFLTKCGAKAFLIGSAVMLADDVEKKVGELVAAGADIKNEGNAVV
jgi:indole-3-glycerol phosphate synthase